MSGYIYQFDVYQGKKKDESAESSKRCKSNVGLGGTVVQELTRSLVGKNHIIMMDNYFSSPLLFEQLKADSIYACGTVRSNQEGLPNLTSDKKMKRGNFYFRISDQGLFFVKWKDNRSVHFLSNYHENEECTVKRTLKDGKRIYVNALTVVQDYNEHMGGVDKADNAAFSL